ncbi:MAG: AtpZ/AtpI family protein [Rhodospirillales bacterium]|nr:AtpZ/AtpI family protein [Alphaproteobacteria bacterium]USO03235.1 MAG: AtpZ/AtpI family protein [Rhodospirillales bacterium]
MSEDKLNHLETRLKNAREGFEEEYNPAPPETDENMSDGARAGIELVGAILGGALLGYFLDRVFDTPPVQFFLFTLLGVGTGFYNVYKITQGLGTSVGARPLHPLSKNAKQSPQEQEDDDQ